MTDMTGLQEKLGAGFGLWLDSKKQPNAFTPEEFHQTVSAAMEVSDGVRMGL
jgi:hypothetical protein